MRFMLSLIISFLYDWIYFYIFFLFLYLYMAIVPKICHGFAIPWLSCAFFSDRFVPSCLCALFACDTAFFDDFSVVIFIVIVVVFKHIEH